MAVDWDAKPWGGRVHIGASVDDKHTASEDAAERGRG